MCFETSRKFAGSDLYEVPIKYRPASKLQPSALRFFKGTVMQIWKSPYVFVFI